jgi:hypothetical protein
MTFFQSIHDSLHQQTHKQKTNQQYSHLIPNTQNPKSNYHIAIVPRNDSSFFVIANVVKQSVSFITIEFTVILPSQYSNKRDRLPHRYHST